MASFEAQDLRIRELARSNGRDEAFAILRATHADRLHRLCLAFFKDPMQAEDALQESFILIWRNLAQYDGRAPLLRWASAITRNCCRKCYRRLVQMREVEMKDVNGRPDDDSQTDSKPQFGAVRDFVDRLPERYRLVVLLFYYEDRSVSEVAQLLGVRTGTVQSRLFRARKAVFEQLRLHGLDRLESWLEKDP